MSKSRSPRATKPRSLLKCERLEDRLTPAPFTAFPADAPLPYSSAITGLYKNNVYPIPTAAANPGGVYYVKPNGNPNINGTAVGAETTVAHALDLINDKPTGQNAAIVFRGGEYRDVAVNLANHAVTFQSYNGEEPVLNGTKVVTSWMKDTAKNLWYTNATGYLFQGDINQAVNPNTNPFYNDLEQVFINGKPLWQVGNETAVTDSTFWTDTANNRIYIKSDPANKKVELTAYKNGLDLYDVNDPDPITVRGLNFTGYASAGIGWGSNSANGPDTVRGTIADCTFSWNGRYGVGIQDTVGVAITGNAFIANGENGVLSNRDFNLSFTNNVVRYNNIQRASTAWGAAGVKAIRAADQVFQDNEISRNYATGLWLDGYTQRAWVLENEIAFNTEGPGVFVEISYDNTVAFNLIHDNAYSPVTKTGKGAGITVLNSSATRVYNNTLVNNYTGINVSESERGPGEPSNTSPDDFAAFRAGVTRDTYGNVIKNNLIIDLPTEFGNYLDAGATKPLLPGIGGNGVVYGGTTGVDTTTNPPKEIYTSVKTLPRITPSMFAPNGLDFNNYFTRPGVTSPRNEIRWDWTETLGATDYATVAAFKQSLPGKQGSQVSEFGGTPTPSNSSLGGIEANSKAINPLFTGGTGGAWTFYRPTAAGLNVGADIPTDILARVGFAAGTKFLGAVAPANTSTRYLQLTNLVPPPENTADVRVGVFSLVGLNTSGLGIRLSLNGASNNGRFVIKPVAGANGTTYELWVGPTVDYTDFEISPTLSVVVELTSGGTVVETKTFTINVADRVGDPTNITLSSTSVARSATAVTTVGTLGAADPDGTAQSLFTYEVVPNFGNFSDFIVEKDGSGVSRLKAKAGITTGVKTVKLRVTDPAGLTFEKEFTINVTP